MMLGEMLCMLAYIVYTKCCQGAKDETKDDAKETPTPKWYIFLPPALCDVVATTMMYVSLTMTSASQFQMLRGSIMIFVGIFSRIFLKKQLEWFRWVGMAVIFTGICIVGGADFLQDSDLGDDAVIGDVICVCAQVPGKPIKYFPIKNQICLHIICLDKYLLVGRLSPRASLCTRRSSSPSTTRTR